MMRSLLLILCTIAVAAGCDTLGPTQLETEVVIESYLVVGEPLANVRITRTTTVDEVFDADALAVRGADVRIELLTEAGDVEAAYVLLEEDRPGVYRPTEVPVIEPLRTYRLVVEAPEAADLVTSTTTVPGAFSVLSVNRDTVVYRSDDPLTLHLSRSAYPGRQSVFVLTTTAVDVAESMLTPFAEARFEEGDVTITELSENVSPILNEESFDPRSDGSLRVQYPWLGVNFYGRNRVTLQAIDDNLYDFIRSQTVQQGGSTLAPGEIPNVLDHVEGGRGVFGSLAKVSVDFYVERETVSNE